MNRRDFLKKSCIACIALTSVSAVLSSCHPLPITKTEIKDKIIKVDKSLFAEGSKMAIVRVSQLEYDILLVKISEELYNAILMVCTHQDNSLTASSKEINCSSHGSRFDLNGKVLAGPATRDLKIFKTSIEEASIIIHIG